MRYMLLIYTPESADPKPGDATFDQMLKEYRALTNELTGAGAIQAGGALQSVATASTVRVRNGECLVSDGPFAETREQLGGFYLVDCKDDAEARAWAAKVPGARFGSIEVRPLMEMA
jgi:hypothetical protein